MRTQMIGMVLLTAATASADVVDMQFEGTGQGRAAAITAGDRSFTAFTGQLLHRLISGEGDVAHLLGRQALYCIDIHEYTSRSTSEYVLTGLQEAPDSAPMGADRAAAVGSLLAHTGVEPFGAAVTASEASAFQLALWEIASDYDAAVGRESLSLDGGWFRARPRGNSAQRAEVLALTESYFDAASIEARFGGEITVFRSGTYQDQFFAAVPTPASALALAAGLFVAVGRRRG